MVTNIKISRLNMEVGMNWLKKTLGICSLSLTILFSGHSSASSETLEIVFKNFKIFSPNRLILRGSGGLKASEW